MEKGEEVDQFELLEEKLNGLIEYIDAFKKEKEGLTERIQIQEEKIADLVSEVEQLRAAKYHAKQKIVSLLEKIELLDIS